MQMKTGLLAAAGMSLMTGAAGAQEAAPRVRTATQVGELVVTALPLARTRQEVASSVAVLAGAELAHRRQGTLGDTLGGVPGVSSDTFGGGASRPVIRGQTAPRVKVLRDGAALMDASEVSPDHAVTAEPLLLERIEILRGPSALLYGGGAIGGAVNVIDRKVPTAVPARGGEGVVEVRGGFGDEEGAGVVSLTAGAGAFAVHVEAAGRRASDYRVPDWEENRLRGAFNRSQSAALGLSWVGARGYLGAAYSEQHSQYGLPGHNHEYESCHPHGSSLHCGGHDHGEDDHDHDHGHEHEGVPTVDMVSRRFDLRGEVLDPVAGVERIRFRGGYTDYAHDEIDEGVVGTTFSNEGYDARVEVQHAAIGGVRGVVGAQVSRGDFAAVGVESFIPESRTESTAIFLLEEYAAGDWRFEVAARQEWQDARAAGRPDADHRPLSFSAAAIWSFTPGYSAALSLSRSQRAPTAQELYARGVHLATNTFEVGDAALDVETAKSVELTLRKTEGATTFSGSVYRYGYDGYIYARTLDRFEDFRLIRYAQGDATFTGAEGELRHRFTPGVSVSAFGDYVRAKLKDGGGDLPRIPAARLGVRTDLAHGPWSADVEYYRVFDQDEIAAFEAPTPGYDMVNATVAYAISLGGAEAQVFVRGTNLLNDLALNHASFIGHVAPLRGRNFVLGLRAAF